MKLTTESTVVNDKKLAIDIDNAQASADNAQASADDARVIADNTNQYFWFTSTGTDTGAHISEKKQADFIANPSGGNLLARSNGIAVRDGLTELAVFGEDARIGKTSSANMELTAEGIAVKNGSTELAVFGEETRVGREDRANITMSSQELTINTNGGLVAFGVSPDGNTQVVDKTKDIGAILPSRSITATFPSDSVNGQPIVCRLNYRGEYYSIRMTKGTALPETTITTPFHCKYSATATSVTITNMESSGAIDARFEYSITTISPLVEVGGVFTVGTNASAGSTDLFTVGNDDGDTVFSVTQNGVDVMCDRLGNEFPILGGDYSLSTVEVYRYGSMREVVILGMWSNPVINPSLASIDCPREDRSVLGKVYNGSTYVDCQISIDTNGKMQVLSLTGQTISGIQISYIIPRSIMYMV